MTYDVKIIADTMGLYDARMTTFEVTAPRFLLAEINTHRVIARSAASSRAIPVAKRIKMVRENPFVPSVFKQNKPGMQAGDALDYENAVRARECWIRSADNACLEAEELAACGVHKEHANRILEPYAWYTGVMSGTEWDNFFKLRTHPDAQPEFRIIAEMMLKEYGTSTVSGMRPHLPYVTDFDLPYDMAVKVSAARCARVSYRTFDGKESTVEKDVELCDDLIARGHMSPFDHPAKPDSTKVNKYGQTMWKNPGDHRHLFGWIAERVAVEKSLGYVGRRDSYAPLIG